MKDGNPQIENGYTRIANEILESLIRYRIPGEQMQVLLFIIRKTYGYGKTEDSISLSQYFESTGIQKPHVVRALNALRNRNIIVAKKGTHKRKERNYKRKLLSDLYRDRTFPMPFRFNS